MQTEHQTGCPYRHADEIDFMDPVVQENWMAPGEYRATWNGTDDSGRSVASGVYFARLELAGRSLQRRMTLLK